MESLKVDRSKLYTQTEYAKKIGVTKSRVNQMITEGKLKIVTINGGKLITIE